MPRRKQKPKIESSYQRIGSRIRQMREQISFTQEDLAEIVGLSRTSIVNIENGNQRILAHHLFEFAAALNVKPETLIR